jgi:formylglycine-generating enzyme required for sulfatase activity
MRLPLPLTLLIAMAGIGSAEEKPAGEAPYPPWDGKESVAAYAGRARLESELTLDLGDGVKMALVLIPAGTFAMGSPETEIDRSADEGPLRDVTFKRPFYMGKHEVTQEQYERIVQSNPSFFTGANKPVDNVTWNEARSFCGTLSRMSGRPFRLPSEAEWEYACRAGTRTPFVASILTVELRRRVAEHVRNLGHDKYEIREKAMRELGTMGHDIIELINEVETDDPEVLGRLKVVREALQLKSELDRFGWVDKNSGNETHPVGTKDPNPFGLYDIYGNVAEWVEDDYHDTYRGAPTCGRAWMDTPRGAARVFRGGSWFNSSRVCRSAFRNCRDPDYRFHNLGFRVVSPSLRAP